MKALVATILSVMVAFSLTACGCSNNIFEDTRPQSTTLIPDVLPTIETNIPDPDIDTQTPIYTESTDNTIGTDSVIPTDTAK